MEASLLGFFLVQLFGGGTSGRVAAGTTLRLLPTSHNRLHRPKRQTCAVLLCQPSSSPLQFMSYRQKRLIQALFTLDSINPNSSSSSANIADFDSEKRGSEATIQLMIYQKCNLIRDRKLEDVLQSFKKKGKRIKSEYGDVITGTYEIQTWEKRLPLQSW